ncbi:hypothetical protein SNE40_010187 [Patella caerulea]|uniref:Alpha/beta hydrolase fold-3 domain-containing protein n=1 Tax=Patella caerulea TaxID=87958 RepID=A0AAN8JTY1_PATCE
MWLNSGSWAQSLLSRFIPSGFTGDQPTQVIRYDLNDNSSSVDREDVALLGDVILDEGTSVDPEPTDGVDDKELPNEHINGCHSPTLQERQVLLNLSNAKRSTRPTSLTAPRTRHKDSPSGNDTLNSDKTLPKKRHRIVQEYHSSHVSQQTYDHNQNILVQDNILKVTRSQESINEDLESGYFSLQGTPKHSTVPDNSQKTPITSCNPNGVSSQICYRRYLTSKRVTRTIRVEKDNQRRHSSDQGFAFLTPESKAKILSIRQKWEKITSPESTQNRSLHFSRDRHPNSREFSSLRKSPSAESLSSCQRVSYLSSARPLRVSVSKLDSDRTRDQGSYTSTESHHKQHETKPKMAAVANFSKLKNKYLLPEETISFLEQNNNVLGKKSTVAERRALYEQQTELYGKRVEFDGIYKHFIAPSIKCKEGLPVDVIRPTKLPQVPTIVIYFHGGDLSTGSRKTSEDFCRYLAKSARCIVVNAEYRLGPDIKLPMQIDDAKCVVRWVKMNRGLLGAVLESKIGVAGDSFGGLIAASVVPEVDSLDFQILICPVLDLRLDQSQPSVTEFENGPCFSKSDIEKVIEQSLPNSEDRFKPLASPLLQSNFNRHPTTFLLIAQIDPFRDAVYEYKQKLVEAEIDVTSYLVKGSVHSFFRLSGHFKSLCEESYQQITDFLHRLVM